MRFGVRLSILFSSRMSLVWITLGLGVLTFNPLFIELDRELTMRMASADYLSILFSSRSSRRYKREKVWNKTFNPLFIEQVWLEPGDIVIHLFLTFNPLFIEPDIIAFARKVAKWFFQSSFHRGIYSNEVYGYGGYIMVSFLGVFSNMAIRSKPL